jgi:hypothetical protein
MTLLSSIERYRRRFAHLRSDSSAARWTEATLHRAPHKPFLLLAIRGLIAQGVIVSNVIELNADLVDAFNAYWKMGLGSERNTNPLLPYSHLQSDGVWHLIPVPGMEQALAAVRHVRSLGQLRHLVLGAGWTIICSPYYWTRTIGRERTGSPAALVGRDVFCSGEAGSSGRGRADRSRHVPVQP